VKLLYDILLFKTTRIYNAAIEAARSRGK